MSMIKQGHNGFDLHDFDSYKEDNRREVKKADGGLPVSLWDTYSAMANTYGGVIICGVGERKDGSWYTTGMKDVSKLKRNFWNQANDRKKVSINLLKEADVQEYEINGDVILVIYVPAADREIKPVYINDDMFRGTFKRNDQGDYHCTESEVKAMLRDEPRKTIDAKVLLDHEIQDLCWESVEAYKMALEHKRPGHAFLSKSNDEFLSMIGAAKKVKGVYYPTAAGLLMFGYEHQILYEYDQYFLDFREHMLPDVRWTDRIQSQSGDWPGNVFDFFTRVSAKLVLDLKKPFKLVNMVRVEETPVHDAVREALVNCLVNTDFYEPRGVVIEKYPEKIVLKNPGTIIVGKKQMLRGGDSEPRNGSLMKMFNLIGYGERAGSGVPDIFAVWDSAGYMKPVVEEHFGSGQPNRTVVTLPLTEADQYLFEKRTEKRTKKGTKKGTDRKRDEIEERVENALKIIIEEPDISQTEIADKLGISVKQAKFATNILKERGKIVRQGSTRSGKWVANIEK